MTRYRKAMVIYVPQGDCEDATRLPAEFDQVEQYLLKWVWLLFAEAKSVSKQGVAA
jgi:hypothetical protein